MPQNRYGFQGGPGAASPILKRAIRHLLLFDSDEYLPNPARAHSSDQQGWVLEPQSSAAIDFDGVTDFVNCGDPVGLRITRNMTIGLWLRTSNSAFKGILAKYRSSISQSGYLLQKLSTGHIRLWLSQNGSSISQSYTSTETHCDGGCWNHVAVTVDFDNEEVRFYFNGKLDVAQAITLTGIHPTTADFVIGAQNEGTSHWWDGSIADAFIYAGAASADDVFWAYQNRSLPHLRPGSLLAQADLRGHWPMNEGYYSADQSFVADLSDSEHHGTITTAPSVTSDEQIIPQLVDRGYSRIYNADATNDYFELDDGAEIWSQAANVDWTISGVFNAHIASGSNQNIFQWGNTADSSTILFRLNTVNLFQMLASGVAGSIASSAYTAEVNKPFTWTIVHDESAKRIDYYINGVLNLTDTYTGSLASAQYTKIRLFDNATPGLWDNLSFFSRALDATEVAELYSLKDALRHSRAADLEHCWRNGVVINVAGSTKIEDLKASFDFSINGAPELLTLQGKAHKLSHNGMCGSLVPHTQGLNFPEIGAVQLLGKHEALNADLQNDCNGWQFGACSTITYGEGFASVTNLTSSSCSIIKRTDADVKGGRAYRVRLVIDEFSATSGGLQGLIGPQQTSVFSSAGIHEDIIVVGSDQTSVQVNANSPNGLSARISHFSIREVSLPDLFDSGGSLTAWVKPRSSGGGDLGVIMRCDQWAVRLYSQSGGAVFLYIYRDFSGANNGYWRTTARDIPLHEWTHIAVTYDDTDAGIDPVLYINGQSVGVTEETAPAGNAVGDSASVKYIGDARQGTQKFDGDIAGIKAYWRELFAAEVSLIYEQERYRYGV